MSLENDIQKLTEAVNTLTARLAADDSTAQSNKSTASKPPAKAQEQKNEAAAKPKTPSKSKKETKEADTGVDYMRDVAPAITALVGQNRDRAVELLAKYGAKKGPQVSADDLPDFLADLRAAISEETEAA